MVKKGGLGKGLDSLIQDKKPAKEKNIKEQQEKLLKEIQEKAESGAQMMPINKIEPNRNQPRRLFEEDALLELADSIKQIGVLQPLIVQKRGDYYEIVAGERRWRASKMAGLKEVPVIIRDFTEQEIVEIALIENIQRENLNAIEEAVAFKRLIKEFDLKQDELAERVSKSRTTVTNAMRLLNLDERVQQMLIDEMISPGHARALLAIEDVDEQYTIAMHVFDEKLSVRETESLINRLAKPKKEDPPEQENAFVYRHLEETLQDIMGTKVRLKHRRNGKGKIEIEYYSEEELNRIYEMINAIPVKNEEEE